MSTARQIAAALAAGLSLAAGAAAGEGVPLAGKHLPWRLDVAGTNLVLHGTAVLRAALLFEVYAAALYLGEGVPAERALDDVPRRLEIHYLHNTPKAEMVRAADEALARNLKPGELAAVRARVAALHAAYEDGRKGGCAALTYVPGRGTEYALDGQVKAVIGGADFAAAYFAVWLGEQPSSRSVKEQLLKGPLRPGKESP